MGDPGNKRGPMTRRLWKEIEETGVKGALLLEKRIRIEWNKDALMADVAKVTAYMEAPQGCPWAGGTFVFTIEIPPGYPFRPPKIRATTRILHTHADEGGVWRCDLIEWSPASGLKGC